MTALFLATLLAADRPNIVLLVADDLGYGELSPARTHSIDTPNLSRLIDEGVYYTDAYVTAPYCAASRAGLMTGRYQTRFGFEFNPVGAVNESPGVGLPAGEETLPEMLRRGGYATALVGKWHLGGTAPFHPLRHGYDQFFGFLHEGHFYVPGGSPDVFTVVRRTVLPVESPGDLWGSPVHPLALHTRAWGHEPPYDANNPILRDGQPVDESEYLTDAFAREAERFIAESADRPFFLCLAFNAVHSPMQSRLDRLPEDAEMDIQRRVFVGMLRSLDDAVGRVLTQLQESGVSEKTLVVFLSDNGGPEAELTSDNGPLRGGKGDVYEGGIRVPFVVRWPTRREAGTTVDAPVIATDLFETFRTQAGVTLVDDAARDGVNLADAETIAGDRPLYWRLGGKSALREGRYKAVRQGNEWQLFDLRRDIGETTPLDSKEAGAKLRQLTGVWDRMNTEMAEPRWQ